MTDLLLKGLTVTYGRRARTRTTAVASFDDAVHGGEWLGLIGPNGAGKSSLLRSVAGLVEHGGDIEIAGRDVRSMSDRERASLVAYVPQQPLIPDDMTAREYALLGRSPYIGYFGSETRHDRDVVDDVLGRLRLEEFADRLLGELSGGERQRVVIARALVQQAPILLLDEPTSALDIGHQQQALELVTELRRHDELTVISAMHDLTLAAAYTDRLTMLHHGAVVASGRAIDVLTADRLGDVYDVTVTVDVDTDPVTGYTSVIVVPRRNVPTP